MRAVPWILVVDDDDSIRELIALILESHGFSVETAEDGTAALKQLRLARSAPPALILLDLMMPGMDGIAFLRELRRDDAFCDVPVVVISGDARATRRIAREDVQAWMIKPIELEDLVVTAQRFAG